jgi:muramoyltetrapeptide carboxypeptidase
MTSASNKPRALRPGDTVAVAAPAAAVDRDHLERGVAALAAMGFRVKVSERALARDAILAGCDRDRADELQTYFADPDVRAIFAARGGYGCGRILPLLDFEAIARAPKIFVGFSDETFILNALVDRAAMPTFHGPMVAMDLARGISDRSREHMFRILTGATRSFTLDAREVIRPGAASGILAGGCLSVVAAMLATPFAPKLDGRIIFLEDTGERAYRIDRMLVQLRQAGVFERAAGVIFGAIRPVEGAASERDLIARFVADQTADLRCPVLFGIEAGHGTENLTIPFGVRVEIDSTARRVKFVESALL